MFNGIIKLSILVLALGFFNATTTAQNSNVSNTTYIGKKCPTCPVIDKWQYSRDGFREKFTNPDFKGSFVIDWETNRVEVSGGKSFRFIHYTNDKRQSVTIEWTDNKGDVMVMQNFYNQKAEYIGTKFER